MTTVDELVSKAAEKFNLTDRQQRNLRKVIQAALDGQPPANKITGRVGRAFYHISAEFSGRPRVQRRATGRL